jgi:integrase
MRGVPYSYGNLRKSALVTTAQAAGVPWVSFHTFRHTCASMLFDRGSNAKQVQW